jgi:hypothetical protein
MQYQHGVVAVLCGELSLCEEDRRIRSDSHIQPAITTFDISTRVVVKPVLHDQTITSTGLTFDGSRVGIRNVVSPESWMFSVSAVCMRVSPGRRRGFGSESKKIAGANAR